MSRTGKMTSHAQRLLDILELHGDWMCHINLAHALFLERLYPYSVHVLQNLAEQGLIEVRLLSEKRGKQTYEYRIKRL